ncbi:cell division suppressor protein YneA [Neobacillus sp. D3-1R]|uniref:cell division suppressor protein YneA n=1 Tax=Neobacillus sp. D3-1R TaxID=3445778 RepID=UPI003F9FFD25
MKKLWSTYSYTILLLVVSCISALFLRLATDINEEDYIKIKVNSGDTLWEMADQYTMDSKLSKEQFINWVVSHNKLVDKQLYPGAEIILPVKNNSLGEGTELASAVGE